MIQGNTMKQLEGLFEKSVAWSRALAAGRLGEEGADMFFSDARDVFSDLKKDIPDLKSPMNRTNFAAAPFALSAYRAAMPRMEPDEALDFAAGLSLAAVDGFLKEEMPWIARKVMGSRFLLLPVVSILFRVESLWDEPEGWAYRFPRPRKNELLSVDVARCGIQRFMEAHGAPDLCRKAICPGDDMIVAAYFPAGTRLERSKLISEGDTCCAFRFILER